MKKLMLLFLLFMSVASYADTAPATNFITTYQDFVLKAYYSEVIAIASSFKIGVNECFQNLGTLTNCNGGTNHIPPNITTARGVVESVTVNAGVITVVPITANGIKSTDTYILTPTIVNNNLVWTASGGGVAKGYNHIPKDDTTAKSQVSP